ncbi:hypothetical protein BOX15_Mlig026758g1 [Macrostomum lignano]|uniref:FERM domain-containing protein n=1 Tax=Macrostomum lignano TaxID=282301 RepID=A0A267EMU6_9PLAT|nr:hypothetical protein BOX15_Mlig026758g1 [Macrostomum lignano]
MSDHGSATMQSSTLPLDGRGATGRNAEFESTMSKKDYYTLRDKGVPFYQSGTMQSQQSYNTASRPAKPSGKLKPIEVVMLDGSVHTFDVDPNGKPTDLFDEVCVALGLHEKEYFGLCFRDSSQMFFWLNNEKKLGKQIGKNEWKLEFMVKFYPPDPENLRENLTRYYMALQIRQNLMAELLPCSFITYIILGSYVLQSEVGDFDPLDEKMNSLVYLNDCPFCPEEYRNNAELAERVSELHRTHQRMTPEEADLHFLRNAKKLAMYGVDLHESKDASGEEVLLGVYHGGVLVYRNNLRINRFSWPKILKVSYKGSTLKVSIRTGDNERDPKSETLFEFKCASSKLAKRLWRAVVEHHGFFRLKSAEKPQKPHIPGTFKGKWGTGIRDSQNDQSGAYQEVQVTPDMRKSFKKKGGPTKAKVDEGFDDDAYNREARTGAGGAGTSGLTNDDTYAMSNRQGAGMGAPLLPPVNRREQYDRRPELDVDRPIRWQMNPSDADPYLAAGMDPVRCAGACPAGVRDWQGCRADRGIRASAGGKWYYETAVRGDGPSDQPVEARVGWADGNADLNLGRDNHGCGFGTDPAGRHAQKMLDGVSEQYGVQLMTGDIVGAYLDLDNGTVTYAVNGKELGPAHQLPADFFTPTGTAGGNRKSRGADGPSGGPQAVYPAACLRDGAAADWNFGDDPSRPLAYPPGGAWRPVGLALANQTSENPRSWRLNPHDTSGPGLQLGPDQLSAQGQLGFGWQGVRANKGLKGSEGGRFYWEAEPLESGGLGRVGWTTESGLLDVGRDANGWGYGADHEGFGLAGNQGKKLFDDEIEAYGEPYAKGDVIGCFFDFNNGELQFAKNGQPFGPAYSLQQDMLERESFFPTVAMRDQTLDVNLGQRPFRYPPGPDWTPVCLAPESSIQPSSRAGIMEASNLPAVDQKYDMIRENKPQIRAPSPKPRGNAGGPEGQSVTVLESRTESEQVGEPEEEIVTYVDEHGNTVTKKIVRSKKTRQVITSKVIETRGPAVPEGDAASSEHLEKSIKSGASKLTRKETRTGRRNPAIYEEGGEEDDILNDIIFEQTGLSRKDKIMDENVNDFSMSTIDARKSPPKHESEI